MSTYEISKSSLLSLKAEILRKQQELVKAKVGNEVKKNALKRNPLDIKNKNVEAREINDQTDIDEDLLKRSKSALEYKAKLYEKFSTGNQSEEDTKRLKHYLVQFDTKKSGKNFIPNDSEPDDLPPNDFENDDDLYQSDDENDKDPAERWVDYVDCFGRTRKCMQKDLPYLMSKDEDLNKIVEEKKKNKNIEPENEETNPNELQNEESNSIDTSTTTKDASELLFHDMRREILRQQWEKEEEELRDKSNIHYQDLLFGEARSHGVGYYGFSKDEEERKKQQEALKKLRQETELKQRKAQELKNSREKLLAARLKAARNRKRARIGLPPEEDEVEPVSIPVIPEETSQQDTNEKDQLLSEARKNHVRPWDIGKEGVKEHQVMSQKEWVEQKREERPKEFAPPINFRKDFRAKIYQDDDKVTEDRKTLNFYTKNFFKTKRKNDLIEESTDFEVIQQSPIVQPTPIKDLNNSLEFDDTLLKDYEKIMTCSNSDKTNRCGGVEIAPPSTYEYYGPSQTKIKKNIAKPTNVQESIEAGLKFLRKQVEEKEKSKKHPDDMFLF